MRFTSSIVAVLAIGSTNASSHLRSAAIASDTVAGEEPDQAKAVLRMVMQEESQDNRFLQDGGATDMDTMERKKAATLQRYEKRNTLEDDDQAPAYAIYPELAIESQMDDDLTTQSVMESEFRPKTATQNDFGIKIVGGEVSDPNEFPFFGTFQLSVLLVPKPTSLFRNGTTLIAKLPTAPISGQMSWYAQVARKGRIPFKVILVVHL